MTVSTMTINKNMTCLP